MKRVAEQRQAKLQELKSKRQEMEIKSQKHTELSAQEKEKKQKEEKDKAMARWVYLYIWYRERATPSFVRLDVLCGWVIYLLIGSIQQEKVI